MRYQRHSCCPVDSAEELFFVCETRFVDKVLALINIDFLDSFDILDKVRDDDILSQRMVASEVGIERGELWVFLEGFQELIVAHPLAVIVVEVESVKVSQVLVPLLRLVSNPSRQTLVQVLVAAVLMVPFLESRPSLGHSFHETGSVDPDTVREELNGGDF